MKIIIILCKMIIWLLFTLIFNCNTSFFSPFLFGEWCTDFTSLDLSNVRIKTYQIDTQSYEFTGSNQEVHIY